MGSNSGFEMTIKAWPGKENWPVHGGGGEVEGEGGGIEKQGDKTP